MEIKHSEDLVKLNIVIQKVQKDVKHIKSKKKKKKNGRRRKEGVSGNTMVPKS